VPDPGGSLSHLSLFDENTQDTTMRAVPLDPGSKARNR
jgi:hypothetical protein